MERLYAGVETAAGDPLLTVHVLAGAVALLAGLGAIVTRKGGSWHNGAGRAYVLTMSVVVVTAAPLSIRIGSFFLLAIAAFSGYLVFAGYLGVRRRRAGLSSLAAGDYAVHGTMVVVGTAMIGFGGWGTITGQAELAPVLVVFGLIGAGLAVRELDRLRGDTGGQSAWFERHVAFMGGGYIATVTAAVTVNLSMIPPLARWLGPTAVGVPLIIYAIRTYRPVFGRPPARAG
ncbi:DUF2306 domain-containing protein [Natrialbaceae archaeon A-gly3]